VSAALSKLITAATSRRTWAALSLEAKGRSWKL
jgi:hypothetical protein